MNDELKKLYMEAAYVLGRAVARVKYASEISDQGDKALLEFSIPEQFKGLIESYIEVNKNMSFQQN